MFIEKIKFIDKVEWFENDEEIIFWNNQKEIIEFYITSTNKIAYYEKETKKLSERLKINCILWQNWVGKTKLLSNIINRLEFEENKWHIDLKWRTVVNFNNWFNISWERNKSNHWLNTKEYNNNNATSNDKLTYIYDDFFIGSNMFKYSINNTVADNFINWFWLSEFYLEIYNFLQKQTHKEIFSNFLNLEKNYVFYLHTFLEKKHNYDYLDDLWILYFFDFLVGSINWNINGEYINIWKIFNDNSFNKIIIFLFLNEFLSVWFSPYNSISEDLKYRLQFFKIYIFLVKNFKSSITQIDIDNFNDNSWFEYTFESFNVKIDNYILKIENILNLVNDNLALNNELSIIQDEITEINKFINNLLAQFETTFNLDWAYNDYLINKIIYIKEKSILLSQQEKHILSLEFFNLDLKFQDLKKEKSFNYLSSWEKIMLIRFVNIYKKIYEEYENWKRNFIILIDEPDLHLHLEWQQQYIQRLIDVFSTIKETDITMHFIIATHSPFIISDIPKENIIKLERYEKDWKQYTKQLKLDDKKETFWANYIDIIRNWFFENWVLMWSFAQDIISNLSLIEKLTLAKDYIDETKLKWHEKEIYEKYVKNWSLINIEKIKEQIWDEFIKNNLLYLNFENDKNKHWWNNEKIETN